MPLAISPRFLAPQSAAFLPPPPPPHPEKNPVADHETVCELTEALPWDSPYRFLIHDRDAIFSRRFDQIARNLGLRVLKTPVRAPKANAFAERALGTLRRECLDFLIPLSENHLRRIAREWVDHYNRGRPHSALGPGLPEPSENLPVPIQPHRHRLPPRAAVKCRTVLGGLHHEYFLEEAA